MGEVLCHMCHSLCNSCKKHQEPPEINLCTKNNQKTAIELEFEKSALRTIQATIRSFLFRKKMIASEKVESILGDYEMRFAPVKESISERGTNELQIARSIPNSDTKQSITKHQHKSSECQSNENPIQYVEQMIQPNGSMFTGSTFH